MGERHTESMSVVMNRRREIENMLVIYEWEMKEGVSVVMNGRGEGACQVSMNERDNIFATVGIYIKMIYKGRDVCKSLYV